MGRQAEKVGRAWFRQQKQSPQTAVEQEREVGHLNRTKRRPSVLASPPLHSLSVTSTNRSSSPACTHPHNSHISHNIAQGNLKLTLQEQLNQTLPSPCRKMRLGDDRPSTPPKNTSTEPRLFSLACLPSLNHPPTTTIKTKQRHEYAYITPT